ncbi:MAG: glycosyltransferase family 4 protein [Candidatus Binataceae bacterium]
MAAVDSKESEAGSISDCSAGRPLRIAGVDPERGFAGGESQVLGLTRELIRMGHRAELICDSEGRLYERAREAGITCYPLKLRNSIDVAGAIRLRSILARERYDIVHFHTSRAHAMAPFARGFARALVVTRRMDYRPNRLFAPYLYSRAVDGVAAISHGVANALADAGVARERVTIIPSGVDCAHFRPPSADERAAARAALHIPPETIVVGTVGAITERKGHRYLLEAIARIGAGVPVVCLLAGDGALREELERQAESLGIGGRVRFMGRIEDTRAMLWTLDIFVFPSLWEGLGVAAIEASACGLAIVASDAGGIGEVVINGKSGILVPPADAAALAEAIDQLAGSPGERSRMGNGARERAEAEFAMNTMAERTLALYRRCIAAKG